MSDIRPIDQQEADVMAGFDYLIEQAEQVKKLQSEVWFQTFCTVLARVQADALSKVLQTRGEDRSEWVGVAKTSNYLHALIATILENGRIAHTRKEELLHNIQIAATDAHEISDELRYHGHGVV